MHVRKNTRQERAVQFCFAINISEIKLNEFYIYLNSSAVAILQLLSEDHKPAPAPAGSAGAAEARGGLSSLSVRPPLFCPLP